MIRFSLSALAAALVTTVSAASAQGQAPQQPQQITRAGVLQESQAKFKAMDANGDGVITKAELQTAQAKALKEAEAARDQKMAAEFKKLDTDNNGSLSLAEFKAAAPSVRIRTTADQALSHYDTDKNGKITLEEYRKPRLALFDKVDANHDGKVTPEEVAAARKK